MKIIFSKNNSPVTQGLAATFSYCGHEVILWDKSIKPTFDMFYEFKPDIVCIYTKEIDACLSDALKQFNKTCVVLETEGIFEPFAAYDPLPACNPVQYGKGLSLYRYISDITYFSYVESDKGIPFLDLLSHYKFKIFGPKKVPYAQYLGYLSNSKEYRNAIKSTKIFIDVNGYDALNAALLEVNSLSHGLNPLIFPECFGGFLTIEELKDKVEQKLKKPKFNMEQKKFAMENTFFHRAAELLSKLGHNEEAEGINEKWKTIRSEF